MEQDRMINDYKKQNIEDIKSYYLQKADENLPKLNKTLIVPNVCASALNRGDTFVLDLGNHYVGYFSFNMWFADAYIDAPVRMSVRFCETKRELEDDYTDYHGELCESWLQEEIINVDFPGEYRMPRRYAARYVKVNILRTPKKISLSDFKFEAESGADTAALKPFEITDDELGAIDRVAVNTLKNCMQRVFEDGPKRDRRLWIGDLRLEALANYYTFDNISLVKRCLYLFAAAERNEYGILPGFVYENPIFCSGSWFLIDYSLMFVCTLCDLYSHTRDTKTFHDLYPIAKSILDVLDATKDDEGLVTTRSGDVFIDWCQGLKKGSALEGIYLYTLDRWCEVLESIGNEDDAALYRARLEQGRAASRKYLYDEKKGAFINKRDEYQNSVHTATWMVLGGVVKGNEAKHILKEVISSPDSVKPFTPYMHHYTVDALIKAGLMQEAEKYIRNIWGGMVKMGADTFFEVYVPSDPDFSPYGDRKVNSMCHAWSCTATYFIRKYGFGKPLHNTTFD
ncbi:MAG: hypothetical protein IJW83_02050 [Clostridia bacterium]|nr:hypothetical protein [Clostridia bacterium]